MATPKSWVQKTNATAKENAFKDLNAFFKGVALLPNKQAQVYRISQAGLWYGDANFKSLPVDSAVKSSAYADLKAFFAWINTQGHDTQAQNLMKAGLWYGDAGNLSPVKVVLYSAGAVLAAAGVYLGISSVVVPAISKLVSPAAKTAIASAPPETVKSVNPKPVTVKTSPSLTEKGAGVKLQEIPLNILDTISTIGAKAANTKQAIDAVSSGLKGGATGVTAKANQNIVNTAGIQPVQENISGETSSDVLRYMPYILGAGLIFFFVKKRSR
jgi:hypothetical protein